MMITLENVEHDEITEEIVIHFSYEGNQMEFKGKMRMPVEKWIASKVSEEDDFDMVKGIIQNELNYLVNDLEE